MNAAPTPEAVIAERLLAAWKTASALPPGDVLPRNASAAEGYAVQARLNAAFLAAGRQPVGWKIGLTSAPAMALFGAAEPMVGVIYRDSVLPNGAIIDFSRLLAPRIEGEMLIQMRHVPAAGADDEALRASIEAVRPAFEIADSRISGWADSIGNAIADNACCGFLVTGGSGVSAAGVDFRDAAMELRSGHEIAASGRGADCMGGVLNVYRWFVENSARAGRGLSPGDIILCGAMGKPVSMAAGQSYDMTLSGAGGLHCTTTGTGI